MEKLEILKQKLSRKKRLSALCVVLSVPIGVVVSKLVQKPVLEGLKQYNLVKYKDIVDLEQLYYIQAYEQIYVNKYPVRIPYSDADTYLESIKANKEAFGVDFDKVYNAYESAFNLVERDVMYLNDAFDKSQAIGFGAGVLSFILIAGIPTAKYLICKRKIKKLEKKLNENKEVEMTA